MATQSIEVKDFTGGRNFLTSPFNIFATEAEKFTNIALDTTGMRTANYTPTRKLLSARGTNPYQVAPREGEIYTLTHAQESLIEKVRFFQGNSYIIKAGEPFRLGAGGKLDSTVIINNIDAQARQTAHTTPADGVKIKAVSYTYYISYRSSAGFESPLKEIGRVVGHKSWDTNYTVESASDQVIHLDALPATGDYLRIYRMGDNISFPTMVFQIDSVGAITLDLGKVVYDSPSQDVTFALLDDLLGNRATTWGATRPANLKYLASTKYGLAAAKGSQLYLSMNRPDAWSELNMLNFGSVITGIASVYRGIVVFTESGYMYVVTGSTTASIQVNVISTDVGCASNSSIAAVGQRALIWVYNRRFYTFNGTTVAELEPNTYDFTYFVEFGFQNQVTAISGYNKYIVGNDLGLIMVDLNHRYKPFIDYDITQQFLSPGQPVMLREVLFEGNKEVGAYARDGSFYVLERDIYGDIKYVDKFPPTDDFTIGCYTTPPLPDDWICAIDTSLGCTPLAGVYGEAGIVQPTACAIGAVVGRYNAHALDIVPVLNESVYKSPMFTFGDMNGQVNFSSVEILHEGELDAFIYIDDVEVKLKPDHDLQRRGTTRILIPNDKCRGNFLQLQLLFNGAVYGYRVNGEPLAQYSK